MRALSRYGVFSVFLVLLLATSLAGCGGSGGSTPSVSPTTSPSPSASPVVGTTSKITFEFELATSRMSEVPVEVEEYRFSGYDAAGEVVYGPVTRAKDVATTAGQKQTVTLEEVPVTVVTMQIDYLSGDGDLVGRSAVENLELSAGGNESVVVSEAAPIVGHSITIKHALSQALPANVTYWTAKLYAGNSLVETSAKLNIANRTDLSFSDVPLTADKVVTEYVSSSGTLLATSSVPVSGLE